MGSDAANLKESQLDLRVHYIYHLERGKKLLLLGSMCVLGGIDIDTRPVCGGLSRK